MADEMFIAYETVAVQLDHLMAVLSRDEEWTVTMHVPDPARPLPPTPPFQRLRKLHGERAGLAVPDQLAIEDRKTGESIYIQGRSKLEASRPAFLISYFPTANRISLLRRVLMALASEPGTWVEHANGSARASGPAFVDRLRADPTWYWGFDPRREPGPPFVDSGNHG